MGKLIDANDLDVLREILGAGERTSDDLLYKFQNEADLSPYLYLTSKIELVQVSDSDLTSSEPSFSDERHSPKIAEVEQVTKETGIPQPPYLYAVPPYILSSSGGFVGRAAELAQLDEWVTSDDTIMVWEAIGGMGKSALTWEWITNPARARTVFPALEGIFWWSFYESGATMESLIRHALAYITRQDPDMLALKSMPYAERARRLLTELQRAHHLLVLDGFERVLVAYQRWESAQMQDDDADNTTERDFRSCTDERDTEFLLQLVTVSPSRILVSTRLMPSALEETGDPITGVRRIRLSGLAPADARAFMQERGVKYSDADKLDSFMAQLGNHTLLLKMVAGLIKNFRRAPSDFDQWYEEEGKNLNIEEIDIKKRRQSVLQTAFNGLRPELRRFLREVAAFGDAVSYETLAVFNPFVKQPPEPVAEPLEPFALHLARRELGSAATDEKRAAIQKKIGEAELVFHDSPEMKNWQAYQAELADYQTYLNSPQYAAAQSEFDTALTELEDRGLLQWDREKNTYDMHPVVRGYSFDRLGDDERKSAYQRIRYHFEQQPEEDLDEAREVADLNRSIMIYKALLGAGMIDEAANFYRGRLGRTLIENIAAYHVILELLKPLFPDGLIQPPRLSDKSNQSYFLNEMGLVLSYLGRSDEALELIVQLLKLDLDAEDIAGLATGLRNYGLGLRDQNRLALTRAAYELARDLVAAAEDADELAHAWRVLYMAYMDTGDWKQADAAYSAFMSRPPQLQTARWQAEVERLRADGLIARGLPAGEALDAAEKFARAGRSPLNLQQILDSRGEAALQQGDADAAVRHFEEAIRMSREMGMPPRLGGLTRARAAQGRHDEARRLLAQGIRSIDAAEVCQVLGDTEQAKDYALKAYESAWADGPPFSWWRNLERAKKVLDALGEPYPDLLPFDPEKVGKIPYEDEIRALIARLQAEKAEREVEATKPPDKDPFGDDDFNFDDDDDT